MLIKKICKFNKVQEFHSVTMAEDNHNATQNMIVFYSDTNTTASPGLRCSKREVKPHLVSSFAEVTEISAMRGNWLVKQRTTAGIESYQNTFVPMSQFKLFNSTEHSLQVALLVFQHQRGQSLEHQGHVEHQHRVTGCHVSSLHERTTEIIIPPSFLQK